MSIVNIKIPVWAPPRVGGLPAGPIVNLESKNRSRTRWSTHKKCHKNRRRRSLNTYTSWTEEIYHKRILLRLLSYQMLYYIPTIGIGSNKQIKCKQKYVWLLLPILCYYYYLYFGFVQSIRYDTMPTIITRRIARGRSSNIAWRINDHFCHVMQIETTVSI